MKRVKRRRSGSYSECVCARERLLLFLENGRRETGGGRGRGVRTIFPPPHTTHHTHTQHTPHPPSV